ncbi:unnamed protein product [Schistosoma mattheei]|uniref:Uncharacterized protein n=1 Tax=Schistosoma mattheei TaxID=31246 RepID=A0A3P8J7Z3_9TREM|nr:unnamed protein product [Schistosoma mattheei]
MSYSFNITFITLHFESIGHSTVTLNNFSFGHISVTTTTTHIHTT